MHIFEGLSETAATMGLGLSQDNADRELDHVVIWMFWLLHLDAHGLGFMAPGAVNSLILAFEEIKAVEITLAQPLVSSSGIKDFLDEKVQEGIDCRGLVYKYFKNKPKLLFTEIVDARGQVHGRILGIKQTIKKKRENREVIKEELKQDLTNLAEVLEVHQLDLDDFLVEATQRFNAQLGGFGLMVRLDESRLFKLVNMEGCVISEAENRLTIKPFEAILCLLDYQKKYMTDVKALPKMMKRVLSVQAGELLPEYRLSVPIGSACLRKFFIEFPHMIKALTITKDRKTAYVEPLIAPRLYQQIMASPKEGVAKSLSKVVSRIEFEKKAIPIALSRLVLLQEFLHASLLIRLELFIHQALSLSNVSNSGLCRLRCIGGVSASRLSGGARVGKKVAFSNSIGIGIFKSEQEYLEIERKVIEIDERGHPERLGKYSQPESHAAELANLDHDSIREKLEAGCYLTFIAHRVKGIDFGCEFAKLVLAASHLRAPERIILSQNHHFKAVANHEFFKGKWERMSIQTEGEEAFSVNLADAILDLSKP